MITKLEADRDGIPVAVYHCTDSGSYSWTHKPDKATRAACDACIHGTIPTNIRRTQ